jgi:hypothetical protein
MATWTKLPEEPLYHQQGQLDFLEAIAARYCRTCKKPYRLQPPIDQCPQCAVRGARQYDYLSLIAARRFGKSRVGAIAGAQEASINNSIGWACAPTVDKLHRYVIPSFKRIIPDHWVRSWNIDRGDLYLTNGALIHFQTLEDPDQGRGQGLDWLWIDEVSELTLKHWDTITPSLADRRGVGYVTTSPRGFDWVYDTLYLPAEQGKPGFWALKARTIDNPIFQSEDGLARIEAARSSMSPEMFRQEYEADFVIFTGAIYGALLTPQILHTEGQIKQLLPEWPQIDPTRPVLVGIDTGADHPFGAVKIISTERGLVVVGEYLQREKSFLEHAAALKRLVGPASTVTYYMNKNEKVASIELAQHGIYPRLSPNDQIAGIERVKTWLFKQQLFFVEATCPDTIKEMSAYRWDENTSRDGQAKKERVYKLRDELPDCLRYALMGFPQLPKAVTVLDPDRDLAELRYKDPHQAWQVARMRKWERQAEADHDQASKVTDKESITNFWHSGF